MTERPKDGDRDRAYHVGNFLECVKSRKQPVENPEIGHHVSTVSHLGNLAFRTGIEDVKALVAIGVLHEQKSGREKLFVHPRLMALLTREGDTWTPHG